MEKSKFFTTGELANIMGISKDTLFYYDRIDLFKPQIITDSGYRYYALYQAEVLNVILTLKEFGTSLDNIKKYLDVRCPENFVDLLSNEIEKINSKIEKYNFLKKAFAYRKEQINQVEMLPRKTCFIEDCKDEYLHVTKITDVKAPKSFYETVSIHYDELQKYNLYPLSTNAMIDLDKYKEAEDESSIYAMYTHITTTVEKKYSNYTKNSGKYISMIIDDGYDNISFHYNKLNNYVLSNNYVIENTVYETIIIDDIAAMNYSQYLVKISVKIND
ncbi:MAG: MerR family transcriptional regulator [Anaeroplasmataceae bacterium]